MIVRFLRALNARGTLSALSYPVHVITHLPRKVLLSPQHKANQTSKFKAINATKSTCTNQSRIPHISTRFFPVSIKHVNKTNTCPVIIEAIEGCFGNFRPRRKGRLKKLLKKKRLLINCTPGII